MAALFWIGALLALVSAMLLRLLPRDLQQPESRYSWNLRPAMDAKLLRLDFYVFLLHAILTAAFVALPFLLQLTLELPASRHWQMYVTALLVSLVIAVPMILRDDRQGTTSMLTLAVGLLLVGLLLLSFTAFSVAPVFLALVLFFAGFTFLEAGLPARLSVLASPGARGASMGVFSSAQFLGAFAGGLIGGHFLGSGRPGDVFFVCALLAAIWFATPKR